MFHAFCSAARKYWRDGVARCSVPPSRKSAMAGRAAAPPGILRQRLRNWEAMRPQWTVEVVSTRIAARMSRANRATEVSWAGVAAGRRQKPGRTTGENLEEA